MPRKYIRKQGSRLYQDYTDETLHKAVEAVKGGLSTRKAEKKFGVPRRTLGYKVKGEHASPVGRPTVLASEEEHCFKQHILAMSEYGFPLDTLDLRMAVKVYLDKKGVNVKQFANNCPGQEWCYSFLKRHKDLTQRFSCNIKKKRAAISEETIRSYLSNLEKEVDGVPPSNIFNYDETNLTDDPGNKKIITKRGMKYPERVMNSSKASISLMYCGTASGVLLPPYVVYKAEHLWDSWCQGGPKGTRYNRTKSGWFDAVSFNDWFFSLALPTMKKLDGKKVLIGDNLSSHINPDVIKACEENNIVFVCLPPNSTHLTQPLDIAFFRPMKLKWRTLLSNWKRGEAARTRSVMPKDVFPRQLKELHAALAETAGTNLKSGFRKAGIVPLQAEPILQRLPSKTSVDTSLVEETFMDALSALRSESCVEPKQKRKKVNVSPGKSITNLDLAASPAAEQDEPLSDEIDDMIEADEHEQEHDQSSEEIEELFKEDWVIVDYEGSNFPGIVKEVKIGGVEVSVMKKNNGVGWKWPSRVDQILYTYCDVVQKLPAEAVQPFNSRGIFTIASASLGAWGI